MDSCVAITKSHILLDRETEGISQHTCFSVRHNCTYTTPRACVKGASSYYSTAGEAYSITVPAWVNSSPLADYTPRDVLRFRIICLSMVLFPAMEKAFISSKIDHLYWIQISWHRSQPLGALPDDLLDAYNKLAPLRQGYQKVFWHLSVMSKKNHCVVWHTKTGVPTTVSW